MNKFNLQIKRSGGNNRGQWRKCIGSTDRLNITLWHWTWSFVLWGDTLPFQTPRGFWLQRLVNSPTTRFQAARFVAQGWGSPCSWGALGKAEPLRSPSGWWRRKSCLLHLPHSDLAPRTSIVMFHAHNSDHNERFCLWKPQFSPWHNSILTNITIIMLNYCLYYWNIYGSPCNVIQTTPRGHYYHYGNKHLHWRASQRHTKDKLLLEWSITNCCVM